MCVCVEFRKDFLSKNSSQKKKKCRNLEVSVSAVLMIHIRKVTLAIFWVVVKES